jgi:hypothetical protein
MAFQVF